MKNTFLERLQQKGLLVGDGAMGSRLIEMGWDLEHSCERWNLEKPDAVLQVHRDYVNAGADFIMTNTFGGCPMRLQEDGLDAQTYEVNQAAAQLARKAAADQCLVLGDIGPCGMPLHPVGPANPDDVKTQFQRQVEGLMAGGVDGFIIETMMDVTELRCAIEAVRDMAQLPILASLCFQETATGFQTLCGRTVSEAVLAIESQPLKAFGSNCMMGIAEYPTLMREIKCHTSLPLLAQPNAGQPEAYDDKLIYEDCPETMMQHVPALVESGASIIGGCCGTTPEFIRLLRSWVDAYKPDQNV